MRAAAHLSHRLRLRRCPLSSPNPHPNPFPSPNLRFITVKSQMPPNPNPHHHPFFSPSSSIRSFSWYSWTGGGSAVEETPGTESELGLPLDGSEPSPELPNAVETNCLGIANGAAAVGGGEGVLDLPVRGLTSLLDAFHDFTGLPWWVSIIISTVALRASLLPVLLLQLKKTGKIAVLFPKLPPPFPPPQSKRSFKEQYALFRKGRRELGCPSFLWSFAYFTVQFPCFLLWMTAIRRMCLDHHPGFDSGGILWFDNLTEFPHSTLGPIFPILIAGLHYVNVQISFQTTKYEKLPGTLSLLAKYYKLYLDVLAIPLLLTGFFVPQGSLVYWVGNSLLTSVQLLSLKNSHVRKKLGLPDEKVVFENKISTEIIIRLKDSTLEHKVSVDSPGKLADFALEVYASGHLDEALALLRRASERDPELVKALVGIGQILHTKGSFGEASEYFERAIAKVREEDISLLILASLGAGLSRASQGRESEGIEHLKRIAQLKEPEEFQDKASYYTGVMWLGRFLLSKGEKSEAAEYLRRAATYDPAVDRYLKECEQGQ